MWDNILLQHHCLKIIDCHIHQNLDKAGSENVHFIIILYICIIKSAFGFHFLGKEGRCFANGMIMFDKAVWSPKHCITCLCSKGKVFCDETSCNPVTCHKSTTLKGECCPVCLESGKVY